jgi:hypothetical protein
MRHQLQKLDWIAKLKPENCPGGLPKDERGWRDLVNRIVKDGLEVGGFTERLYKKRQEFRKNQGHRR